MSMISKLLEGDGEFGRDLSFQEMGEFIQATVTDNSNKDFPGMVKVEFTAWKDGGNICDWLPVLQGFAGAQHGTYLLPDVGDVVLVGFIGAGMKRPFVLGSLFPANAKMAKDSFVDKNVQKRFVGSGGTELLLNEKKNETVCSVTTPKGMVISVDEKTEQIALSDKDKKNAVRIDCKNGAIEVLAEGKITLKTGKCELVMDGKSGAVNLKCDRLTLKANQQATISSGQMMTVEGNILKAEGKQTAQFKGGTMLEVSGGMVKIN